MIRIPSLLCAGASALALIATPALAQSYNDEIIVGPPTVERHTTGRSSSGIPIEEMSITRVVSARDLDLRYDADVHELHRRISVTARAMCDDLDRASSGLMITSDRECVRDAVRDAMAQVDVAIYHARG